MIGGWATNDLITFSPDPEQEKLHSEVFSDVYGFGHKQIYTGVYEAIVNNGKPAIEFDDAMGTIQLLHAIYRSAELGEWVNISDKLESARLGQPDEDISLLYRSEKPDNC